MNQMTCFFLFGFYMVMILITQKKTGIILKYLKPQAVDKASTIPKDPDLS